MALFLDKDEYFSMNAYVEAPGEQRIVLSGYLIDRRSDGTYIAPLIPELFYGANGSQLAGSWRQNFTQVGDQVVLSRGPGDNPKVPKNELYWRKVESKQEVQAPEKEKAIQATVVPQYLVVSLAVVGIIVGGLIIYKLLK